MPLIIWKWDTITLHPLAVRSRSNLLKCRLAQFTALDGFVNNAAVKKYGSYPKGSN